MDWRTEVLKDSPTAFFRAIETSGTSAADAVGGTAGTYSGTFALAQFGLLLPNVDQHFHTQSTGFITVAKRTELDLGDVFTIEFLAKFSSVGGAVPMVDFGSGGPIIRFADSGNAFILRKNGTSTLVTSTASLSTGVVYHIVARKNGATSTTLTLNNANVTGTVTNATMGNSAVALNIGCSDGGTGAKMSGNIGECALYKGIVLSDARVQAHFAAAMSRQLAGV